MCRALAGLTLMAALAGDVSAQDIIYRRAPAPATPAADFALNALIGGATSAIHAALIHKDPYRAFALGSLGGGVHYWAKRLGAQRGDAVGIPSVVLSGVGISIVNNSARGKPVLSEVSIPIWFGRLTYSDSQHLRASLTVADLAQAYYLTRQPIRVDWRESLRAGVMAFRTEKIIRQGRETLGGIEVGGSAVVSAQSYDLHVVRAHEEVHVKQFWFLRDTWTRPIEMTLRRHSFLRRIPSWIEVGGLEAIGLWGLDQAFGSNGPLHQLIESEAYGIAR